MLIQLSKDIITKIIRQESMNVIYLVQLQAFLIYAKRSRNKLEMNFSFLTIAADEVFVDSLLMQDCEDELLQQPDAEGMKADTCGGSTCPV